MGPTARGSTPAIVLGNSSGNSGRTEYRVRSAQIVPGPTRSNLNRLGATPSSIPARRTASSPVACLPNSV